MRYVLITKALKHRSKVGKLYEIISDEAAESDEMLRVIDEDGEDYLFEARIFYPLAIPTELAAVLHERA